MSWNLALEQACRCRLRYPLQSPSGSRRASGSKRSSVSCRKHLYSLPRGVVAPFFFLQSPSCHTCNSTNYLDFATGSQALYLGFTLHQKTHVSISIQTITSPSTLGFPPNQNPQKIHQRHQDDSRRVRPIRSATQRRIHPMLLQLPLPDPRPHDRIRRGGPIHHVAHPRVPAGLDLAGVELLVPVVDPARSQRQLLLQVLIVLVAVAVGADQGAGFGVAWIWEG